MEISCLWMKSEMLASLLEGLIPAVPPPAISYNGLSIENQTHDYDEPDINDRLIRPVVQVV